MTPSSSNDSQIFLVAYDYGMGGLWGLFRARSEASIKEIFPELKIVHHRPPWMTDVDYDKLLETELHEIDGAPWGILNAVLEDRERRRREGP